MRLLDDDNLKDLSAEDLDLLRKEIKTLDHRVRTELESRHRSCSYCGQQTGDSLQGFKYCSAWHRYLGGHHSDAPLSRLEFERKRALHRIRVLRNETAENPVSSGSSPEGVAELRVSLRNIRIRQILNEYRTITGEGLKQSLRDLRKSRTSEV
jgi:hypothetical protein